MWEGAYPSCRGLILAYSLPWSSWSCGCRVAFGAFSIVALDSLVQELFGVSTIEQFGDWFSKVITIPSVVAMYPTEFTPRDRGCLSTNRIALFPEPIVLRPMTFGHLFSGRWGMISQYYVSNIVQSKVTKPNALSSLSVLHMRYISLIPSGTYDSTRVALPTVELAPKKALS